MKFIEFNNQKVDSFLFIELQDLAITLSKIEDLYLEFAFQSYWDPAKKKVTVSHFWDHRSPEEMIHGLKSDIYLRSIGNVNYSDWSVFQQVLKHSKRTHLTEFQKQLFILLEDIRLEAVCGALRSGTTKSFYYRKAVYRKFFQSQLKVNQTKSIYTDALFNTIYLILTTDNPFEEVPSINKEIDLAMPFIQNQLTRVFDATSTKEVAKISFSITEVLEDILARDMLNMYFHLPELYEHLNFDELTLEDLKRKDPLKNRDILDKKKEGDEDVHDETMPIWHRETSDKTKSFLQFNLDQGSQSDMLGEGGREGDAGDQAMGMVQGSSKKSRQNDYSEIEALEQAKDDGEESGGDETYGKENRHATVNFIKPKILTNDQVLQYEENKRKIAPYQKKLKQMIQKTLEHKKILPRSDLHFGRLNKNLIRMFTDDNPRLFYKKQEPSSQIDAVFSLLVDCSASMLDKMEETKLGITLFHEALRSLLVPHSVIGFWEDTADATEEYQPNYFRTVVDFTNSFERKSGAHIMQLEAEEDNRDGLAIRVVAKQLRHRLEKQKFLLVFSDGEPAAFGYEQNGIIDTHEAVMEARKQGIEVINVFLANGEIDEGQQKTIENIYGNYSILVSNVEELPDVLFPLLKKLLLKSI